jgi:Fic family protein
MYNWELENWAKFIYNENIIDKYALKFTELSSEVFGVFKTLDDKKQQNEIIGLMISEAIKTSEIEGEILSREDVMSSIRNKLGLNSKIKNVKDKRAENVALLMLQVRKNYREKLTEKMLKTWHALLFANSKYVRVGTYRKGKEPMQIVSGSYGKEKVHYEAPPSKRVPQEMKNFVRWYNGFKTNGNILKIIVKTAIAHLYFESIHPFEDGNGRIGRALIEKCLSESLDRQIIMSVSSVIVENRKKYYSKLAKVQHTLQIDSWLVYFAKLLIVAQQNTIEIIGFLIKKTQFFDKFKPLLNTRQTKAINKMFDAGTNGFEGGMTAKKYISITKTTKATATRDLQELVKNEIFTKKGGGRSTHYLLNL